MKYVIDSTGTWKACTFVINGPECREQTMHFLVGCLRRIVIFHLTEGANVCGRILSMAAVVIRRASVCDYLLLCHYDVPTTKTTSRIYVCILPKLNKEVKKVIWRENMKDDSSERMSSGSGCSGLSGHFSLVSLFGDMQGRRKCKCHLLNHDKLCLNSLTWKFLTTFLQHVSRNETICRRK